MKLKDRTELHRLVGGVAIGRVHFVRSFFGRAKMFFYRLFAKKITKICGIVLAAVAVIFVVVSFFGSAHFLRISVGGDVLRVEASDKDVAAALDKQAKDYRLNVVYPDGTVKGYSLTKLGLSLDNAASLQNIRQRQQSFSHWFLWWRPISAPLVFHEDVPSFKAFIASDINYVAQQAKSAVLTIDGGSVKLADAADGVRYSLPNSEQTVLTTAQNLETDALKLQKSKVEPALSTALMKTYKDQIEKIISQPASIKVGSQTLTPSPAEVASWLIITPDEKAQKVSLSVNGEKVTTYINGVAASVTRSARSQVEITQSDGSKKVVTAGTNGTSVSNVAAVIKTISDDLISVKGFSLSLALVSVPFKTVTQNAVSSFGGKWIEVDTTVKRLYAYEGSNLVATFLVSAGAPATPTVTGTYSIYAKYKLQDMRGLNADGSSYYQPDVPWISYFYGGYSIHGNYWRPLSYFGNVNSSHGCVGLVNGDAEWLYYWAPVGTPVVVHR